MDEARKVGKSAGNRGKGRKKGTPNKTTAAAKAVIEQAAAGLGGAERLLEWCKEAPENERTFWGTIYPKLLPLQVKGDPDAPLVTEVIYKVARPGDD